MIEWLHAVDPGKKQSAVATFDDHVLAWVGLVSAGGSLAGPFGGVRGHVVIEVPRSYPGSPVPPNDLIDLIAAGAMVAGRLALPGHVPAQIEPAAWKGQVPKQITQGRIYSKMNEHERYVLTECMAGVPKYLQHNLWDAIGIGLVHLGRARRGII